MPGDNLQTTLDLTIQAFAQQDLQAAVKQWKAQGGRILVLNPKTGGILAMAQWPEPAPANWQNYPMQDWADQPVQYAFEPGSTIKPFTASAALSTGTITTHTLLIDHGHVTFNGVTLYDWIPAGFGPLHLDGAMAVSSDVFFSTIAVRIGVQHYFQYLNLFHLNRPTGIDLPGESGGIVPPENPDDSARPWRDGLRADHSHHSRAVGRRRGDRRRRRRVACTARRENADTAGRAAQGAALPGKRLISTTVAQEVQQAMLAVVSRSVGTGTLARVPGYVIAGKTGTANLPSPKGGFYRSRYLASFIGFGPVP
ncbi:peptidoglycan glycosyltransferase, partial [mine drainage metagenome]